MNKKELHAELEKTIEKMGITVKYDKLQGDGGYCKYKEKEYVIINKILPREGAIRILTDVINEKINEGRDIFIEPALREYLDRESNAIN